MKINRPQRERHEQPRADFLQQIEVLMLSRRLPLPMKLPHEIAAPLEPMVGESVEPLQVVFQRVLHAMIVCNGCPYFNPSGELNVSA
jgi:hypothetical protein